MDIWITFNVVRDFMSFPFFSPCPIEKLLQLFFLFYLLSKKSRWNFSSRTMLRADYILLTNCSVVKQKGFVHKKKIFKIYDQLFVLISWSKAFFVNISHSNLFSIAEVLLRPFCLWHMNSTKRKRRNKLSHIRLT